MATWPDIDEAEAYIGEVKSDQLSILEDCLAAAIDYIDWRCAGNIELDEGTEAVEADPEADPPVEAVEAVAPAPIVRPTLREASLMLTSRLFRRRLSPEGVSDFGEFGAVRVSRVDPDIERLITPARSWGIA